jgi:chemotaxis protein MotB
MIRRHSLKMKKQPQRDHTDDWLMTYADMITLLLCFFAVFLSVSVPKRSQEAQLQKPLIIESSATFGQQDDVETTPPLNPHKHIIVPTSDQIGDRITALQMSSNTFFAPGSATLTDDGIKVLGNEVAVLKSSKYREYEITVEGHTDDMPVGNSVFASNWELSAARASAVVHFFIDSGIAPFKLRAAGYADTYPRVPNRDAHGNPIPENQAKNRRVVIKLEKMEQAD